MPWMLRCHWARQLLCVLQQPHVASTAPWACPCPPLCAASVPSCSKRKAKVDQLVSAYVDAWRKGKKEGKKEGKKQ